MSVAVLGGGITGACLALELADRGVSVDLYEQDAELVARASLWNEGKIHLGLTYARDPSRKSAATMLEGALRFRPLLERWIGAAVLDAATSDPFIYAVHRTSMLAPAEIEAHFRAVAELCEDMCAAKGGEPIAPLEAPLWQRHENNVTSTLFDDAEIVASYSTQELSIDPLVIASHLRSAIVSAPNINVLTETTVTKAERNGQDQITIVSECGGSPQRETYQAVANALWQNRIALDATIGLDEERPVIHRFKAGMHSKPSLSLENLPTVTFVLGEFGDAVSFGSRAYLSWYPAGHLFTCTETMPSLSEAEILGGEQARVEAETLQALARLLPAQKEALLASVGHWDVRGGFITAWGTTGIDDRESRLHERFEVGVNSFGSYHSIDTGKYTLGPHFADIACKRLSESGPIAPARSGSRNRSGGGRL